MGVWQFVAICVTERLETDVSRLWELAGNGAIEDYNRPEKLTGVLFNDNVDDLGVSDFNLSMEQAETYVELVRNIPNEIDRAKAIRAIYAEVFKNDTSASWFGLGAIAADVVVGGLQQSKIGGLIGASHPANYLDFDENARIAFEGLADGNIAVFESQFLAYAAYRNGGVVGVQEYAASLGTHNEDIHSTLVSGYEEIDSYRAALRSGDTMEANIQFEKSLVSLASHEQGSGVLQAIYDRVYGTKRTGGFLLNGTYASSLGDSIKEMQNVVRFVSKAVPFAYIDPTEVNVVGTRVWFGGDNIGNFNERWKFVTDIADAFLDVRRQPNGVQKIVDHHQRLLDHDFFDTATPGIGYGRN